MAAPAGPGSFDAQAEAILRAFEQACGDATREPGFEGVYLSPSWENETRDPPEEVRAWKRSVLRRVVGAGADPWGHLFLVVVRREGRGAPTAQTQDPLGLLPAGGRGTPRLGATLYEGPPRVYLMLRPRAPATEGSLGSFASAVQRAFLVPRAALPP